MVDDDSSIRWVLERALNNANFACTCFDSANAVLTALENSRPDVLLSDIRMPGTNGIELLNTIKQSHRFCRLLL
ncbi:response regulator [Providencia rettgeri]|uniref:Response regulator n=1 Tax=Providencia rettgeri TaxID=587 RepID=A0A939NC41_PRORE|nr:response regulator [Providencia rettgeri]